MPEHDIVVIGASAGGVEALSSVMRDLPADFGAAILVVLHVPPNVPSALPQILTRAGHLSAGHATDGQTLECGCIYVAPPARHLVVDGTVMRLSRDAPDRGYRPAVDVLFRSVAQSFGPRAIGVVLSGNLYDGTAGLADIVDCGGVAFAQQPEDARFPGMPRSAIEHVAGVRVLPAHTLGRALVQLIARKAPAPHHPSTRVRTMVRSRLIERTRSTARAPGTLASLTDTSRPLSFGARRSSTTSDS